MSELARPRRMVARRCVVTIILLPLRFTANRHETTSPASGAFHMFDVIVGQPAGLLDKLRCKSTIELMLPCSIEQFRAQLAPRMGRFGLTFRPIFGTLQGTRLTARMPRGIFFNRSARLRLSAELTDCGNQTLLCGTFTIPLYNYIVPCLMLPFAALASSIIISRSSSLSGVWHNLAALSSTFMSLTSFLVLMIAVNWWGARNQRAFLINFLRFVGAKAAHTKCPMAMDI